MKQEERTPKKTEGLTVTSETERLKRDMERSDMEKIPLFTQMLRNNLLLKKAVIRHK